MAEISKNEKFRQVTNPRLKKAIKYLRMVKASVTSNAYEVTAEDIDNIVMTLHEEVDKIRNAFDSKAKKEEIEDVL